MRSLWPELVAFTALLGLALWFPHFKGSHMAPRDVLTLVAVAALLYGIPRAYRLSQE